MIPPLDVWVVLKGSSGWNVSAACESTSPTTLSYRKPFFSISIIFFSFSTIYNTHLLTAKQQTPDWKSNQDSQHLQQKNTGKVAQQPHFYLWPNNAEYSGHCQLIYACIIIKICKIGQSIKETKLEHKAEKTFASEIFCTKLDQISQNRPTKKSNQF